MIMQNFTITKSLAYFSAIISFLFLTSCLNDVDNSQPTQFQIGMEIQNVDSSFTVGQDSMYIESVRIILGVFNFETDSETLSLKDSTGVQLSFEPQTPNYQNPRRIAGGQFPDNNYQSINITFPKAPENSSNIDSDFTGGDGKSYTIIAEGTYNGSDFTYKSERNFENSFPLSLSTIPEEDAFFGFLIQTDVRDWFRGGQGLLDPTASENSEQINDNIEAEGTFRLEQDSSVGNQPL